MRKRFMSEKEDRVCRLLAKRAYIFTCSSRTAWDNWLEEDEKEGFTYDYIIDYLNNI